MLSHPLFFLTCPLPLPLPTTRSLMLLVLYVLHRCLRMITAMSRPSQSESAPFNVEIKRWALIYAFRVGILLCFTILCHDTCRSLLCSVLSCSLPPCFGRFSGRSSCIPNFGIFVTLISLLFSLLLLCSTTFFQCCCLKCGISVSEYACLYLSSIVTLIAQQRRFSICSRARTLLPFGSGIPGQGSL